MDIFKKNKKVLIALSVILGLLFGLKIITLLLPLKIIFSAPKNNQRQVPIETQIVFTFNKNVSLQNWKISLSPDFLYSYIIEENSLKIIPQKSLLENTEYKIQIANNKLNIDYSLVFTTKGKTISPLITPTPRTFTLEEVKKYYEDLDKQTYKDMPLFDYIPYQSKDFLIDYIKPLTLEVLLVNDTPEIRQKVLDWIISKGVDPKTHQIEWKLNR